MCKWIKTSFSKIFNEVKNHPVIIVANFLIFVVGGILSWQIWGHGGGRATFGPLNIYFFLCFSLIIATAAAVNLAIAATVASRSLRITKSTQRPFLNVCGISVIWSRNDGSPTPVNYFVIHISNTGIFPADQVSIVLNVSKPDSDNQKHLFVVEREIPSICFPGEEIINLIFREAEEKEKLTVALKGKLKVQIEVSYQNKLTQEIHKTIRSYLTQYFPTAQREPTPLRQEDFWD